MAAESTAATDSRTMVPTGARIVHPNMSTCQVVETTTAVGAFRRHERIAGTADAVCSRGDADAGADRRAGHGVGRQLRLPPHHPTNAGHYLWLRLHGPCHGARPGGRGPC